MTKATNEVDVSPSSMAGESSDGCIKFQAISAIKNEASALNFLAASIDERFVNAVTEILSTKGRLIVTGIGKSGHIARKVASTFSSTGTSALYIHPSEASHGDLGMIGKQDCVLVISKSGESPEMSDIINYCRRNGVPIIAICAQPQSSLGKLSSHIILLPQIPEACPMGLAPTTSTTMALALGDALAICCLQQKHFDSSQFKEFHPGGQLGKKLTKARDVMHAGEELPIINHNSTVGEAVIEMSRGRMGCVAIVDDANEIVGIYTDGDLRRGFSSANVDRPISLLMTRNPNEIQPDTVLADVAALFSRYRIPSVFVTENHRPVGIVHVHDLLKIGLI